MFNIFGTRIDVRVGDPLIIEADGMVLPANDHLWMGTGLGGAVKKAGGEAIEAAAVRQGPAQLGEAVATDAGDLHFRRLYHAVLAGQDLKTHVEQVGPALRAALGAASRDGLERIVIAPLADEAMLGTFHEAARQIVRALLDEFAGSTRLKEVVLAVEGDEGRDAYRQALHAGLKGI